MGRVIDGADVDVDSRDIFEHLDLGAMIHAEVRHRSGFGAIADYSFMDLSGQSEGPVIPGAEIKAEVFQGVFEAFASYRFEVTPQHEVDAYGSFPANGYGLYDMAGNVWEHVADWWVPGHPERAEVDPKGPPQVLAAKFSPPEIGPQRVVKGGSWLCAPNFCLRYRPAARQPSEMGLGSNHIGFRIVKDVD